MLIFHSFSLTHDVLSLPFKGLGSLFVFAHRGICQNIFQIQFKIPVFYLNVFSNVIYSCDAKAAISPVFMILLNITIFRFGELKTALFLVETAVSGLFDE